MATITLRLDDETRAQVEARARGRGISVSEFLRIAIDRDLGVDTSGRTGNAPLSLTMVERRILVGQHKLMAMLADDPDEESHHANMVEVLTRGYTGEYHDEFGDLESEVSQSECALVWDLLDMFVQLRYSIRELPEDEQTELGDQARRALGFTGFDFNDSRESRMAGYARFLVTHGRWEALAEDFDRAHENGNSHMPRLEMYLRLLGAFKPIWDQKIHSFGGRNGYQLSLSELQQVYAAWPYPRQTH